MADRARASLRLQNRQDRAGDGLVLCCEHIDGEVAVVSVEDIERAAGVGSEEDFERRLYILRKVISNTTFKETDGRDNGFYIVSLSCRTMCYKGMFLAYQLGAYYKDLKDQRITSALALVHQRFSTNTFPSWKLAHPYRMVAHNGEINTLRGNVNWMAARQATVASKLFGDDIQKLCSKAQKEKNKKEEAQEDCVFHKSNFYLLQYYLEDKGIRKYFFMDGGANNYFKSARNQG